MVKDKRVTVFLTESQFQLGKQLAEEKEISLAEFIRRAVTVYIKMLEKYNAKARKV